MISFFHKIVDVLNSANIPYMLSGSVAMGVYIVPRTTRDIDFVVYLQPQDIDEFVANFKDQYHCDKDSVKYAVEHHSLFNIIDHSSGYKADFIILKNEEFRQEEFKRKIKIEYFDRSVYLVSVEDLLLSKIIWIQDFQYAQQVDDIKNLLQLNTLNLAYIKDWINKLNLKTFNLI